MTKRTINDMVQQEVMACMSSLVYTLAQSYGMDSVALSNPDLPGLIEQAFELACPVSDYEEAAIQAGWEINTRGKWWHPESDDGSRYVNKESGLRGLCEDHDIAPYDREVFEHWAVSSWLAEKLIEHGEKVDTDFAGLNVWARTCSGQGIASDGVIERIYADMMKD